MNTFSNTMGKVLHRASEAQTSEIFLYGVWKVPTLEEEQKLDEELKLSAKLI